MRRKLEWRKISAYPTVAHGISHGTAGSCSRPRRRAVAAMTPSSRAATDSGLDAVIPPRRGRGRTDPTLIDHELDLGILVAGSPADAHVPGSAREGTRGVQLASINAPRVDSARRLIVERHRRGDGQV
jgi:hypothetical protein